MGSEGSRQLLAVSANSLPLDWYCSSSDEAGHVPPRESLCPGAASLGRDTPCLWLQAAPRACPAPAFGLSFPWPVLLYQQIVPKGLKMCLHYSSVYLVCSNGF